MVSMFEHLWTEWWTGLLWIAQQILCQVPGSENYFWMVTVLTFVIMLLEWCLPWRKEQRFFRKDWYTDLCYLYANLFLFAVILNGFYTILFNLLPEFGHVSILSEEHWMIQLVVFFVLQDFLQWWVHRLLHANQWLWRFHQIHHSVEQMGVAAHFRYHWMENVLYKPTTMATLSIFAGVEPKFAVIVHAFTLVIGHLNHCNIRIDWGPLRYVFNSSTMHLLHHSRSHLRQGGVNFGLSLSCWDYLFGTAATPSNDGELELGFDACRKYPVICIPVGSWISSIAIQIGRYFRHRDLV